MPGRQQRRRAARLACRARVVIMTLKGPMPGTIVDLSVTGCRILCPGLPPLALSSKLNLIDHGLELRAERRWLRGDLSGWRFLFTPKEAARLSKLLVEGNPALLGDGR